MKKTLKRNVIICLVLVVVLAGGLLSIWRKDRQREAEVRADYEEAMDLIEQKLYEDAYELLEQVSEKRNEYLETDELISLCQAHLSYDDGDLESAYNALDSLSLDTVSSVIQTELESFREQLQEEYDIYLEEKAIAESEALEQAKKEKEEKLAAQRQAYLENLSKQLPYVGMYESYIGDTVLGEPSSTVRHNTEMINGQRYTANLYDFKSGGTTIFTARCVQGKVIQVWDKRDQVSSGSSSSSSGSGSSSGKSSGSSSSDQYHASDYDDPEEFYYDHYDDFDGYEDAEVYWEDAQ
ncbi:MAG: hypothetical protein LUI87_02710 [Lachnospiraceae bacterium]|nr:hypothetical protein [Lachnospiraceae bacterium]